VREGALSAERNPMKLAVKETILLVERKRKVPNLAVFALRKYGYAVITVANATQAFDILIRRAWNVVLIITDEAIPEMSSRVLVETMRCYEGDLKFLFMSDHADTNHVRASVHQENVAFLKKPFAASVLADKVREMLGPSEQTMSIG
jgi:DNA-binding NtrC family response regulator